MANKELELDEEHEVLQSFFPSPPPFWKSFTPQNQERLKQIKTRDGVSSPQISPSQLLSLPVELRYLIPPAPPADDDEYTVFSQVTKGRGIDDFDNIMDFIRITLIGGAEKEDERTHAPILVGWKYGQLFPSPPASGDPGVQSEWTFDRQSYLLRFVRSILLNYVELLGIMAVDPMSEHKDEKLKDILGLVANAHALVNDYRPHQARETLITMMEDQLERKRAEVEGVRRMKEKVDETLAEFAKNAPDGAVSDVLKDAAAVSGEAKRRDTQRHMWYAMDEMLGH